MTSRLTFLGLSALALGTIVLPLAGSPAAAFTFETLSAPNSNGSRFADPDDQSKNFGNGTQPGLDNPYLHFGGGLVNRFGPPGFAAPPPRPPEPYANGNND